jgi:hypothetical protein
MLPFQILVLQIVFGMFASIGLGLLVGWKVLRATDSVLKCAGYIYVGATLLLMAFAVLLCVLSLTTEPFAVIPVWIAKVALASYFTIAGVTRGLSIQKHGRWV